MYWVWLSSGREKEELKTHSGMTKCFGLLSGNTKLGTTVCKVTVSDLSVFLLFYPQCFEKVQD